MYSRISFGTWRLLSLLMAALSFLNLLNDLTPIEVIGKLKLWLTAYTELVDRICGFLFGWIQFGWIEITQVEYHVLVISLVLTSAFLRAQTKFEIERGETHLSAVIGAFFTSVMLFLLTLVPALLLPGQWGFWGAVVGTLVLCNRSLLPSEMREVVRGRVVLNELAGVVGILVLALLVNNIFLV